MLLVDAKSLVRLLNRQSTRALEAAIGACIGRTHYEVTVEHLLAALLEDAHADVATLFLHFDVDVIALGRRIERTLGALRSGNSGKPVFSLLLLEWFQDAH